MCELWESQIHDSPSEGVTMDILAAMNRVTLDIVGLAGEMLYKHSVLTTCHYALVVELEP